MCDRYVRQGGDVCNGGGVCTRGVRSRGGTGQGLSSVALPQPLTIPGWCKNELLGFKPFCPLACLFSLGCVSHASPGAALGRRHTTTHHGTPRHIMAHHGTHWHTAAASRLLTRPVPTAWPRGSQAPRRLASPGLMPLHAEPQSLLALPASAWSQEQAGRVAAGLPASWQLVGGTCASCMDV